MTQVLFSDRGGGGSWGPNGTAAIHIEAAVMPGEHVFNNDLIDLAFGFEHFQDFISNQIFDVLGIRVLSFLKYSIICKTAVCCNNVEVGMKILKITEGLHSNDRSGFGAVVGCGLFQVGTENFPGTTGKHGKQFSVVQEIDAQPLGNTEHLNVNVNLE